MSRVRISPVVLALALLPSGWAAPEQAHGPKTPADALRAFEVKAGFKVELVVAAPLVQSPMACDFDEDGRLYVVELPEYNAYAVPKPPGKGRVVRLDDTDGDGVYDKRTVFADSLDYPTGVICWDGGVYVGAAPDLLYLKDTNGDGMADVRQVKLTGFGKDKAGEGQLNSFRWTPDNRILISTGLDGGELAHPSKRGETLSVRGMNVLLDPRTNAWERTSGGGQHGMSLDDWGRVFVSGNSDPIHVLAYDARYVPENSGVRAPAAAVNVLPSGKFTKLHRISEVEPWRVLRTRLRKEGKIPGSDEGGTPSGFFTGATGVTVYRGDAFPAEYRGDLFVGEVANNLVFRAKLKPNGVLPVAERADPDKEFLASRDTWFRPVQFANAPDGCLYVLDMSRELIEGAAFLAPEVMKSVDPVNGFDKGRIWRVVPDGFRRPAPPKLGKAATAELVKLLDHPNGWHRDTAARLLYQRQDKAAVEPLKSLVKSAKAPQGRVHALHSLAGMKALDADVLQIGLADDEARVREHAVRLCEGQYHPEKGLPRTLTRDLWDRRIDPDPAVRVQLAYTLGRPASLAGKVQKDFPTASAAPVFVQLAIKDIADPWMRLALLASMSPPEQSQVFADLARSRYFRTSEHGPGFLLALGERVAAATDEINGPVLFDAVSRLANEDPPMARSLLNIVRTRGSANTLQHFDDPNMAAQVKLVTDTLLANAVRTARDGRLPPETRVTAVRDLTILPFREATPILKELLQPAQPPLVQAEAVETVGRFGDDGGPALLLAAWPAMTPQVRATATEVWLGRNNWVPAFLDAVEEGKIARGDLDPARAAQLRKAPARNISARAAKLFAPPADRQKVFEAYRPALAQKGDAARGKAVFAKNCAACHKLEGVGEDVGADLKAVRDRGLEGVLLNILDPNREVKPQFLTYMVELKAGRQVSGMLTAETPTGFTVRRPDGKIEAVRRADVESLKSTGLSYMPEGLEKQIDPAAMADLLAYLNSIK
ncbi:MAG TPA: PVC-type heme-binding CxxCH protein [Gemmataceae bacterium]|nr:PVC-type heme-binding CxxCH protein [Gemmataceae bacterium]